MLFGLDSNFTNLILGRSNKHGQNLLPSSELNYLLFIFSAPGAKGGVLIFYINNQENKVRGFCFCLILSSDHFLKLCSSPSPLPSEQLAPCWPHPSALAPAREGADADFGCGLATAGILVLSPLPAASACPGITSGNPRS